MATTHHDSASLIDLHRHLDGDIAPSTIIDLAKQCDVVLPSYTQAGLVPYVYSTQPCKDLKNFLDKMLLAVSVLHNLEACERIAYESVQHVAEEGLLAAELRFSPLFMASAHKLNPTEVTEAVIRGVQKGQKDFSKKINLIGILSRTFGPEHAMAELKALLHHSHDLVAIDLAGDELNFPAKLFIEHFDKARKAGLEVVIHAGEGGPCEEIADAILLLGARRIGHGTKILQNPEIVQLVKAKNVGLEVCLTSNVQTQTVKSYKTHPVVDFLNQGILCTLATDDPGVLGIDLNYEYTTAAAAVGLTTDQITLLKNNAYRMAFDK